MGLGVFYYLNDLVLDFRHLIEILVAILGGIIPAIINRFNRRPKIFSLSND